MSQNGLTTLFENATAQGSLSQGALQVVTVEDIGTAINAALGVSVDDVKASEVVLATLLIDDSGSIRGAGNEQAVREGDQVYLSE